VKSQEAIELYRIAVEMADRVSERRGKANQFYLSLQVIFLSLPTAIGVGDVATEVALPHHPLFYVATGICGIAIAIAWLLQLRSYRDLNRAKFKVINKIEKKYFKIRPFASEWESLQEDRIKGWRGRYAELGTIERVLPWVFMIAQAALVVVVLVLR
jgi:hypothetical protein